MQAREHESHEREGASTAWVEVCWRCAEEWKAYIAAHPEERPPHAIVLAVRPAPVAASGRRYPPFGEPSEAPEYETTMAGRKPCPSCGEWVYPQRPIGLQRGFAFPPNCQVCGAVLDAAS